MESVAGMSVGVSVSVRKSDGSLIKNIFDPIIYKGDLLPCTRSRVYRTTKEEQNAINLKVYGGENALVEDNLDLGNFLIENIPKEKAGKEKVDITFHMDKERVVHLSIKIKSTGREETRRIDTNLIQRDLESFNSLYKKI